jgi:exodeoxyribonuclease VII small subunit
MTDKPASPPDFEAALGELEKRVRRLESGEVPLEEALRLFEEGVELARACHDHLEAAEKRVASLVRRGGSVVDQPLPEPSE